MTEELCKSDLRSIQKKRVREILERDLLLFPYGKVLCESAPPQYVMPGAVETRDHSWDSLPVPDRAAAFRICTSAALKRLSTVRRILLGRTD